LSLVGEGIVTTQSSTPPSRQPIDQIRLDVIKAMAVRAALQLGVFTPLADGPMTSDALADVLGVRPRRLKMLLLQLAAAGFLELDGDRFANSPIAAHYLVQGRPNYYGGIHQLWTEHFTALLETANSIRADKPMAKIDFDGMTPDELTGFLKGIHGMAVAAGRNLAEFPQFGGAKRVVDVGGGSGGVAIGLCEALEDLQATVVDLPSVAPIADEMALDAGLADRIDVLPGDVLGKPLQGGFDVATARSLFQVLSPEQCQQAARFIWTALRPGGTLFVIGIVIDDSGISPDAAVGMNILFLNMFDDGQAYTETQYRDWLSDAGFVDVTFGPFLAGNSLITARKA
jgi:SAM-dependent methyltransferase